MAALLAPVAAATPLQALALRDPQTADAIRAARWWWTAPPSACTRATRSPAVRPVAASRPVCRDLTYNPRRTALLRAALAAGATPRMHRHANHQGALSLEKWTGEPAPVEVSAGPCIRRWK